MSELLKNVLLAYSFANQHVLVLALPAWSVGGVLVRTTRLLATPIEARSPFERSFSYWMYWLYLYLAVATILRTDVRESEYSEVNVKQSSSY